VELDPRQTLIIAILVLFLGRYLNARIRVLRDYNIPEPVTGGLLASLFTGLVYWVFSLEISFDLVNRDMLLIVFFTTIGLSSRLEILKKGGRSLMIKYKTNKRPLGKISFQYSDALHELNRVIATKCAEIALALVHLQIFCGRFQAVAHRSPCRPNVQWRPC
jgi:hypothetical protein